MATYIAKEIKCATATKKDAGLAGLAKTNGYCIAGNESVCGVCRSFFQYDLSGISNVEVRSALLHLFVEDVPATFGKRHLGKITSDWEEENVTWNNMPSYSKIAEFDEPGRGWYTVDVTDIVKEWLDKHNNNGFVICYSSESYVGSYIKYTNRYSTTAPQNASYIEIDYVGAEYYRISEQSLVALGDQARRISGNTGYLSVAEMIDIFASVPVEEIT